MNFQGLHMSNKLRIITQSVIGLFIGYLILSYSDFIQFTKLKSVKIIGCQFLSEKNVRAQLNFPTDQNLLTIDVDYIQNKLEKQDFLKSCRISRIFPSTLLVEIFENEPIAVINKDIGKLILDEDGTELPFNKQANTFFNLPEISIKKYSMYGKNHSNNGPAVISTILTSLKSKYPEIYTDINSFDFNGTGDVVISFDRKTKIYANERILIEHFRFLDEFRKTQSLHHVLSNYSTIDLRVDNQIIVKTNT